MATMVCAGVSRVSLNREWLVSSELSGAESMAIFSMAEFLRRPKGLVCFSKQGVPIWDASCPLAREITAENRTCGHAWLRLLWLSWGQVQPAITSYRSHFQELSLK